MSSEAAVSLESSKTRGIASTEDDLNRSIIKMLQQDGRLPYKDIARELGVMEPTVGRWRGRFAKGGLAAIEMA